MAGNGDFQSRQIFDRTQRLFEAANKIPRFSPAFPTVVYHQSRLLIETKKPDEARKLLDDILNSSLEMPISSRNQFLELRLQLAQTLGEFLTFAQRKPFAFNFDGNGKTIDEIIAERKKWYDPKYDKETREEFEREIDKQFADEKLWQNRLMFDDKTIAYINEHFPLSVLIEASKSPALPEYLQKRFVINGIHSRFIAGRFCDGAQTRARSRQISARILKCLSINLSRQNRPIKQTPRFS